MIEEILTRRSIRRFLQKPIPQADLDEILEAGMWAPSEKNAQEVHRSTRRRTKSYGQTAQRRDYEKSQRG